MKEDTRYRDADIEDDYAGVIWLPGDEEFDSVDNVRNNVGEDDDDEGNEGGNCAGSSKVRHSDIFVS